MPSSYVLGEHFEKFIKAQIESGRYNSASEVVREAMRLLEDQEHVRALRTAEIIKSIQEARADLRPPIPAEEVFTRLQAKYEKMARDADKTQ